MCDHPLDKQQGALQLGHCPLCLLQVSIDLVKNTEMLVAEKTKTIEIQDKAMNDCLTAVTELRSHVKECDQWLREEREKTDKLLAVFKECLQYVPQEEYQRLIEQIKDE